MPYSWRNNLSTTVDSFLQVLSKWLEHFVEDEFIIEPCLDVVAGHGQFHAIPFPGVDAAGARGRQDFSLVAYLLDGALCIAARAEIQPAVVLRINIVEYDDETLRAAILAGGTFDGVMVRWDKVLADGQRRLFARGVLQDAVVNLPAAPDNLGLSRLGQRFAVGVAHLCVPCGIAHATLDRGDAGRVVVICHRTGRKQACAANEGGSEHPQQDLFHK